IAQARSDARGNLSTRVTVPEWADRGRPYVLVIDEPGLEPRAVSEPFVVGTGGDRVVVEGTLTDEGVECPALRDRHGTLYTLAVRELDLGPGTAVRVEGTIAEASICMQGTTLDVERLERR